MLKLAKYELRKDRNILFAIGGGLLVLQIYYMISLMINKQAQIAISASLLFGYAFICFFTVFILAVTNYSREMNSKSSYLIFMTPNSSLSIILSKMLTILLIGVVLGAIIGILGTADLSLLYSKYPDAGSFTDAIKYALSYMGIDFNELLVSILLFLIIFLLSFFSLVGICYLAITLSATLLQNSKLKVIASIVFFFIIAYIQSKIQSILPMPEANPDDVIQTLLGLWPSMLFQLVILLACIFGCAALLEKKVSL